LIVICEKEVNKRGAFILLIPAKDEILEYCILF
jgi:hypothetical protein